MDNKTWTVSDKDELFSLFKEVRLQDLPLMIWQQQDKRRVFGRGQLKDIRNDRLFIQFTEYSPADHSLQKSLMGHFSTTSKYYSFSGETSIEYLSVEKIVLSIPHKMSYREIRESPFSLYKDSSFNEVTFNVINRHRYDERQTSLMGAILQLTKQWVQFYIVESGSKKLGIGESVEILDLPSQKIIKPCNGKIESISYFHNSGGATVTSSRVTVVFETPIIALQEHELNEEKREKQFGVDEAKKDRAKKESLGFIHPELEKSEDAVINIEAIENRTEDDLFWGYSQLEQHTLMAHITIQDKELARELKDHIDYLNQLVYLTVQMKQDLIRQNNLPDVACALKLCTRNVITSFLSNLSQLIQSEVLYHLRQRKPLINVLDAQRKLIKYIRNKEGKGEFILNSESFKKKV